MAGGAWEYMANSIEENLDNESSIKYIRELRKYTPNFATIYKGNNKAGELERLANYKINKGMYGDAIWEISNANEKGTDADNMAGFVDSDGEKYSNNKVWNNDYIRFQNKVYPFFIRGGGFNNSSNAGIYCLGEGAESESASHGFRVVAF